jgi:hypothetical protein
MHRRHLGVLVAAVLAAAGTPVAAPAPQGRPGGMSRREEQLTICGREAQLPVRPCRPPRGFWAIRVKPPREDRLPKRPAEFSR